MDVRICKRMVEQINTVEPTFTFVDAIAFQQKMVDFELKFRGEATANVPEPAEGETEEATSNEAKFKQPHLSKVKPAASARKSMKFSTSTASKIAEASASYESSVSATATSASMYKSSNYRG